MERLGVFGVLLAAQDPRHAGNSVRKTFDKRVGANENGCSERFFCEDGISRPNKRLRLGPACGRIVLSLAD